MKKVIAALLSLGLAASLMGCGKKPSAASDALDSSVEDMEEAVEETMGETALGEGPNGASDADPTWQLDVLEQNQEIWLKEDTEECLHLYAVTDLDHNGQLEIIVSYNDYYGQGDGQGSFMWEVQADRSGLQPITLPDELEHFPTEDMTYCVTNGKVYQYTFSDFYNTGNQEEGDYSYNESIYYYEKQGNEVITAPLGRAEFVMDDPEELLFEGRYFDTKDNEISKDEFRVLPDSGLSGGVSFVATLMWGLPEWYDSIQEMLGVSYSSFGEYVEYDSNFDFELYTNPDSETWKVLHEQNNQKKPIHIEGLTKDIVRDNKFAFITPTEGLTVTLEYGWWSNIPTVFQPVMEDFSMEVEPDTVYEFEAPVTEDRALMRLKVHKTDALDAGAEYYLMYKGEEGLPDMVYLCPEMPALPKATDDILEVCRAYAAIAAKYENHYGIEDEHYWEAVASAVDLVGLKNADVDHAGNFYLDEMMMNAFTKAMFPYKEMPSTDQYKNVRYRTDAYERYVIHCDLQEIVARAEVKEIRPVDPYTVCVVVNLPTMGNMPVEVQLNCDTDWYLTDGFDWVITAAEYGWG